MSSPTPDRRRSWRRAAARLSAPLHPDPDAHLVRIRECDRCPGPPATAAERRAVLASALVTACACWTGNGAPPSRCTCGPDAA